MFALATADTDLNADFSNKKSAQCGCKISKNYAYVFLHDYANSDGNFCITLHNFALLQMFLYLYPHIFQFLQISMHISALGCGFQH